jgi:hypothetical protein
LLKITPFVLKTQNVIFAVKGDSATTNPKIVPDFRSDQEQDASSVRAIFFPINKRSADHNDSRGRKQSSGQFDDFKSTVFASYQLLFKLLKRTIRYNN